MHGRFLWVSFQLDDLCEAASDRDIRETLRNLPRDLAETYIRILRKIKDSRGTPERFNKIQRIFKWIVCAERPLKIEELTEAIAIDTTDKFWDSEKMCVGGERLISQCGSLVIFDKETRAVRLAHYTVQQFLLSPPVDYSLANLHMDLSTATVQLGEACITYLSFSDFETQLTRRRKPLPVGKKSLLNSAIDQAPFGKRIIKPVLTSWSHVRGAGANSVNPVVDLTNHLTVDHSTTLSETMHAKYHFLKYAIDYWTWHTKSLTRDNQLWNAFADLALNKQMTFEFRPWDNVQSPHDFPYATMFGWAINAGHVALLQLMPFSGSDLRNFIIFEAQSSVMAAVKKGSTEVLQTLCEVSGLSLRDLPTDGIVCDAASEGRDEFLEALLMLDADPNAKTDEGRPALACAFLRQQDSAFELLLQYRADPDISLCRNDIDKDKFWLFGPGYFSKQDTSPLLYLAVMLQDTDMVRALLGAGANCANLTKSMHQEGRTPLEAAVEHGLNEMVKMLLEGKAEVNYFSGRSPTPLQRALGCYYRTGTSQMVELLLSANADPNLNPHSEMPLALCAAARDGRTDIVKQLLKAKADVNIYPSHGMTALQAAAAAGHVDVVEALLAAGADVNLFTPDGPTLLQAAAQFNNLDLLVLVLKAKADINAVSREEKRTPVELAVAYRHFRTANILLAAEADGPLGITTQLFVTAATNFF